jgi:hypothetical protein
MYDRLFEALIALFFVCMVGLLVAPLLISFGIMTADTGCTVIAACLLIGPVVCPVCGFIVETIYS